MIPKPGTVFRLQAGAWGTVLVLCLGLLGYATGFDPDVPFLGSRDGPDWIMAPPPITADLIAVDPAAPPVHVFSKQFHLDNGLSPARLRGWALKSAALELNGETLVATPLGSSWKQGFKADLQGRLQTGRNTLRVSVANPTGPALLRLEIETRNERIATDAGWRVAAGRSHPIHAEIATDVALHPESRLLPSPLEVPRSRALILVFIFAMAAGIAWRSPQRLREVENTRWPSWTLATVTFFWFALFCTKFWRIPVGIGFDAPGHLAYIDFLLEFHALPTAAYGFSTYHPPLFYLLTSAFVGLFSAETHTTAGQILYRVIPFLSGLANVWITARVAQRIWPGEGLRPSLAIATVGLLPMNLYMSAYVSNEPLLATWVSAALAMGTGILLAERVNTTALVGLTGLLGAALLTKFTALGVVPIIAFFVALGAGWSERHGLGRALAVFAGLGAGSGVIAGWFYLRNWRLFGDPLVWNLDVPGAATWWMRPGFHTPEWYLNFGEALSHPTFAGYTSFWDGIYSTLWGDGLVAGMARVSTRHGLWNDDFQLLTYPLALPVTLVIAVGAMLLWRNSFAGESISRRLVLSMHTSVLFGLAFSLLWISLRLPFYAQAKAFYLLCGVLPLALASAEGLAATFRWPATSTSLWRRALHCGWVGWMASFAASILLAYLG
jgi:hypothetical protein